MLCPKCGYLLDALDIECPRCARMHKDEQIDREVELKFLHDQIARKAIIDQQKAELRARQPIPAVQHGSQTRTGYIPPPTSAGTITSNQQVGNPHTSSPHFHTATVTDSVIGKTCPYCQTPIKPGAPVFVCSVCGIPHHTECWRENRRCTTFGCTGVDTDSTNIPPADYPEQQYSNGYSMPADIVYSSTNKSRYSSTIAIITSCIVICAIILIYTKFFAAGTLHGQIFVTTKGGVNVKLGSVTILLYSPDVITPFANKVNLQHAQQMASLRAQIIVAKADMYNKEAQCLRNVGMADLHEAYVTYEQAATTFDTLTSQLQDCTSDTSLFQDLPPPILSTTSDANGEFTLPIPRYGKHVICAQASRQLQSHTEAYYWMISTTMDGDGNKSIVLANNNMADANAAESLLRFDE